MRIRLWIPIRSLGWVNSYVFEPGPGLVDAGMLSARSILDLARGLRGMGYKLSDIERVVLTHFHVDHSTMTALLRYEASPDLFIGRGDYGVFDRTVRDFVESATRLFLEHGAPRGEVEEILRAHPALRLEYAYEEIRDADWILLSDGDTVRLGDKRLRVIETPGHTPGSIVLYDEEENVLYTGDTLLPGITPHVTLHDPETDPLGDYLASLEKIAGIGAKRAYPGHRDPIDDPAGRAREIIKHHEQRLAEIKEILEKNGPMTGYDVAKRVRWRTRYSTWSEYPPAEKFFALGEALAHLRHLEVEGEVEVTSRNGILYWRTAGG